MAMDAPSGDEDRRRRARRIHERSRVALFDVFREAFEDRRRPVGGNGDEVTSFPLSARSNARRVGVDELTLRNHVHEHLKTLMNSIRLDAITDLSKTPEVAQSIANYGFQDLSDLTRNELLSSDVARSIKQSLSDHEPRLMRRGIEVTIEEMADDVLQRLSVRVSADLIADPADIPVDYEADIDVGSGKVLLTSEGRS